MLGLAVIVATSKKALPAYDAEEVTVAEYLIEAEVSDDSPLVGKSVIDNRLRDLETLFLVEIVRADHLISPVSPSEVIEAGDKLILSGDIKQVEVLDSFDARFDVGLGSLIYAGRSWQKLALKGSLQLSQLFGAGRRQVILLCWIFRKVEQPGSSRRIADIELPPINQRRLGRAATPEKRSVRHTLRIAINERQKIHAVHDSIVRQRRARCGGCRREKVEVLYR